MAWMVTPRLAYLIWANRGVRARVGQQKWSNATGGGQVDAKRGEYYDAIYNKRHEFWLVVMNLFGGINVEARKLFKLFGFIQNTA